MLTFGTDGVRGRALTELTPADVAALGRAAGAVLGRGDWLIGRDPRESGPALAAAFAGGLDASVRDLGVVPTPVVAFWSQRLGVPAAVVTASHNPWHDNGVKVFAPGGLKLADDVEQAIEAELGVPLTAATELPAEMPGAADAYVDHLAAMFEPDALGGLRIVLDCANGAVSEVAARPFLAVGAMVSLIHAAPDGRNINEQCGATAPGSLCAAVVEQGADLGLAFDGDGDRVIAVDHLGNVVDGDRLLALAALQLRDEGRLRDDTVVVTVMSNLGFRHAMDAAGIHVVETGVGDRYVLEALDTGGWSIGGEQSGHIIYRDLATTGDGILAGLRLAADVVRQARPLADMAGRVMTSYPQVLVNVRVAERHPNVADELAAEIADAESRLHDDGRILVRASGTEPLVRVMVEAATADLAQQTADDLATVVRARFA